MDLRQMYLRMVVVCGVLGEFFFQLSGTQILNFDIQADTIMTGVSALAKKWAICK